MLEKLFKLTEKKTTVKTEVVAGITTFMTMAYILAVNPDILSKAGMPAGGVFMATAIAAVVGTLIMAFMSNYPFVLAPGMGLNAFFAFTVCNMLLPSYGYSWQFALLAVFVEGLVFLLLSLTPVREGIFNAIPFSLKKAVAAGIGMFIAFIALQSGKVIVCAASHIEIAKNVFLDNGRGEQIINPVTMVKLAPFHGENFSSTGMWSILTLVGVVVIGVLLARKVRGAVLIGILVTWLIGIACQLTGLYVPNPSLGCLNTIPDFSNYGGKLSEHFTQFGDVVGQLFNPAEWKQHGEVLSLGSVNTLLSFFGVMFAFFFVDLFDTLGTLIGVSMKAGFLDEKGKLPRISGALCADSIATSVGAVLGTSTTTTYVESASGVMVGGRTGLTAVSAAALFAGAILLSPVFLAIPGFATAPALVIVGYLMLSSVVSIDFSNVGESIPAFLTILAMPLAYSISDGIMFGVISYTLINLLIGQAKRIHWIMYVLTVIFIAKYALM